MVGLVIFIAVLAIAGLAVLFGVDSRDGFTDPRGRNTPLGLS